MSLCLLLFFDANFTLPRKSYVEANRIGGLKFKAVFPDFKSTTNRTDGAVEKIKCFYSCS